MFTVSIAGTNRTRLVDYYSLSITNIKTDHPDTCTFTIKKFGDRTYSPNVNDEVIITDSDGTRIFAGNITDVEEVYDKVDFIAYRVNCIDYTRQLDNRLIVQVYENMSVNDIVAHIKANYLENSITINNVNVDTVIDYIAFNYEYPSDAIRQLAEIASADFYVDYYKDIHLFHRKTELAPFNLSDNNGKYIYDSLIIRRDLTQLRNVVYVRGSEFLAETTTAEFVADGDQRDFFLPYKFSDLRAVVTGQEKSVGVDPIDQATDFDALHNFQEKAVRFREDRKPTIDSNVKLIGRPNLPLIVKMRDTASIMAFTTREHIVIDKSIKTKEGARQRALAELLTYRTTLSEGSFRTYQSGLKAGQKIVIQSDLRGLNEEFIVNRVQTKIFGTDASDGSVKLEYGIDLITVRTYDYIQFLKNLLNRNKKELVISDNEILDQVESVEESMAFTVAVNATTQHNDVAESATFTVDTDVQDLDYPVVFVLGPYVHDQGAEESQIDNTTSDSNFAIYSPRAMGQWFTAPNTVNITKVRLRLNRAGSPGTMTVGLYAVDGSNNPTGSALSTGTFNGNSVGLSAENVEVTMSAYTMQSGTKYAIVMTGGVDASNAIYMHYNASSVIAGNLIYASTGSNWSQFTSFDLNFQVYGGGDFKRQFVLNGSRLG